MRNVHSDKDIVEWSKYLIPVLRYSENRIAWDKGEVASLVDRRLHDLCQLMLSTRGRSVSIPVLITAKLVWPTHTIRKSVDPSWLG